jgi:hypothetical protein
MSAEEGLQRRGREVQAQLDFVEQETIQKTGSSELYLRLKVHTSVRLTNQLESGKKTLEKTKNTTDPTRLQWPIDLLMALIPLAEKMEAIEQERRRLFGAPPAGDAQPMHGYGGAGTGGGRGGGGRGGAPRESAHKNNTTQRGQQAPSRGPSLVEKLHQAGKAHKKSQGPGYPGLGVVNPPFAAAAAGAGGFGKPAMSGGGGFSSYAGGGGGFGSGGAPTKAAEELAAADLQAAAAETRAAAADASARAAEANAEDAHRKRARLEGVFRPAMLDAQAESGRVGTFHVIQSRTRVMGWHFSRYFAVKTRFN